MGEIEPSSDDASLSGSGDEKSLLLVNNAKTI